MIKYKLHTVKGSSTIRIGPIRNGHSEVLNGVNEAWLDLET